MRNIKFVLYANIIALFVVACSCTDTSREMSTIGFAGDSVFCFTAELNGDPGLRAADNMWSEGDAIGVYLFDSEHKNLASNKKFITTSTTSPAHFSPATIQDRIDLPKNQMTDILAYYPYDAVPVDGKLTINLREQQDPAKINFLTADNLKNVNSISNLHLQFTHRLSKLVFNLNSRSTTHLSQVTAIISGTPALVTYTITDNSLTAGETGDIVLRSVEDAGSCRLEAFVAPDVELRGAKVIFRLSDGKQYSWPVRDGQVYRAGHQYVYQINLNGGIAPNPVVSYVEMPVVDNRPNTSVVRHFVNNNPNIRSYTMLYDKDLRMAYWVAYPLHGYYRGSGRKDTWVYDPMLPEVAQYKISKGFNGGSYDRGHQLPSADRNATAAMNAQTFYFSNATAQLSSFNQGVWNRLEGKVRAWQEAIASNPTGMDTLYVVTGAAMHVKGEPDQVLEPTADNNGVQVNIPSYYYKALAKRDAQGVFHTIAFLLPHKSGTLNYRNYCISVTELEQKTGFTFFPGVPDKVKKTVESDQWSY